MLNKKLIFLAIIPLSFFNATFALDNCENDYIPAISKSGNIFDNKCLLEKS
jgi:hypothetical protein